jgi:hypothetical protein
MYQHISRPPPVVISPSVGRYGFKALLTVPQNKNSPYLDDLFSLSLLRSGAQYDRRTDTMKRVAIKI